MNLFHDAAAPTFTLAELQDFVTTAELAIGPLVGIFPQRDGSGRPAGSLFYFDAEDGHLSAEAVTELSVVAAGSTPPGDLSGKPLVCIGRVFIAGNAAQLAAYRPASTPQRLDLSMLPLQHIDMAELIVSTFETVFDTPSGVIQHAAALANAMAESGLNPNALSPPPEVSVGLFQCNVKGAGVGFTVAQLQDAQLNANLALKDTKDVAAFKNATTVDDAVHSFVADFERPADIPGAVATRQKIARQILRS